jgi:regulator of sirC expression with transglutaminase-like and TPR domain
MNNTGEINALLRLLEDPDQSVYHSVSERILHYGNAILPNLESSWQICHDPLAMVRIENIMRQLHFKNVRNQFSEWVQSKKPELLQGALLLGRFFQQNPDEDGMRKLIKSMHQSCWLELNDYLTPLEQVNVINSIFFSNYKFNGLNTEHLEAIHFNMHHVADSRNGNAYSLGIFYQILCEMLDIPVYMVLLPRHTLLAYFNHEFEYRDLSQSARPKIQFYIDANSGMLYSQNDVEAYIKKYKFQVEPHHFNPLSNTEIISYSLQALYTVYEETDNEQKSAEVEELLQSFKSS